MKRILPIVVVCMLSLLPAINVAASDAHAAEPSSHTDTAYALTPAEGAAQEILFLVADAGIVMLVLSFVLCLMRVVKGPTLIDRGIATDTITLHVVGIAILLTIAMRTLLYFDAVLIFAILGFATTVAFAQFIGRRGRAV